MYLLFFVIEWIDRFGDVVFKDVIGILYLVMCSVFYFYDIL